MPTFPLVYITSTIDGLSLRPKAVHPFFEAQSLLLSPSVWHLSPADARRGGILVRGKSTLLVQLIQVR